MRGSVRRCPPLSCRTSPPQGGRSAGRMGFANRQRSKASASGKALGLPPSGGDVRQDRGGRCPASARVLVETRSPKKTFDALRALLATACQHGLDQGEMRLAFSADQGYTAAPFNANQRRDKWVHFQPSPFIALCGETPVGYPPDGEDPVRRYFLTSRHDRSDSRRDLFSVLQGI